MSAAATTGIVADDEEEEEGGACTDMDDADTVTGRTISSEDFDSSVVGASGDT